MQTPRSKAAYRWKQGQIDAGRVQVQVWLSSEDKDALDSMMRQNGYRNRSELMQELIRETTNRKGT